VLLLTISACFAQLVIENPKHLKIPEDQAQALLRISCQAVANELHLQDKTKFNFGLRLVLGEKDEHFGLDNEDRDAHTFSKRVECREVYKRSRGGGDPKEH
jgi:hypothetical protein